MREFTPHRIYGIIGRPLDHSLSPLLHTTGFAALGMPAVLVPWPLPAEELPLFFEAFRLLDFGGAGVTVPHKRAVIPFLDDLTGRARTANAVNTLFWRGDGRLAGDNTDVAGFQAPWRDGGPPPAPSDRALILGAGGAARAAVIGCRELGLADLTVTARRPEAAEGLARDFGLRAAPWAERADIPADLVVNATPVGLAGRLESETPFPAEGFAGRRGLAYDLIYTPAATRFLREARAAGWRTVNGLPMFLGQAEIQFRLWTGRALPEAAREAVRKALNRKGV